MGLTRLGSGVSVVHRDERLCGSVAVGKVLEEGAAKGVRRHLGYLRDDFAVALDNESGETALEVGFAFPGQFVAFDGEVRRRRGSSRVGNSGIFNIL